MEITCTAVPDATTKAEWPGWDSAMVMLGCSRSVGTSRPKSGIGVFYMKDTRRDRIPPEYESIFIHHYKRWVVGPSRAEISFNYLF